MLTKDYINNTASPLRLATLTEGALTETVRVNIPPDSMSVRFGDTGHFERWLVTRDLTAGSSDDYVDPFTQCCTSALVGPPTPTPWLDPVVVPQRRTAHGAPAPGSLPAAAFHTGEVPRCSRAE